MGNQFAKLAQESITLCPIMAGRDKITTEEIIGKELTIIRFGFAPKSDERGMPIVDDNGCVDTFGVVVFKEHPDKYYCVGTVFTKVCRVWSAEFDDDPERASDELEKTGGVKVRFGYSKTKRGNNLVSVEILG